MRTHGKRFANLAAAFDAERLYDLVEATQIVKKNATAKFNETIEIHVRLGVDPKKSDQNVRGTVSLPNGTGRTVRVIVFARGDAARAAQEAGRRRRRRSRFDRTRQGRLQRIRRRGRDAGHDALDR